MKTPLEPLPERIELPMNRLLVWLAWGGAVLNLAIFGGLGVGLLLGGQIVWGVAFLALTAASVFVWWTRLREGLVLDRDGFAYRIGPRTWRSKWADCDAFEVRNNGGERIVIRWKHPHPVFSLFGKGMTSEEVLLNAFGLRAQELVDLMNRFRARALGVLQ
jgi:hypothetical protein